MNKKATLIFFLCVFTLFAKEVFARPLNVSANITGPCVINKEGYYTGFSADLLKAVLEQEIVKKTTSDLNLELNNINYIKADNVNNHINNVINKTADIAIGCITITKKRMENVQFSIPTANSGLQIMVRNEKSFLPSISSDVVKLMVVFLLFLFVIAHPLWFFEKGKNENVSKKYIPGISILSWFGIVTSFTVGYGDLAPKTWPGRFFATIIMFFGILLTGSIISNMAAEQINKKLTYQFESPYDLRGKTVVTKANTTSVDILKRYGAKVILAENTEQARDILIEGKDGVIAFVHDKESILYLAKDDDRVAVTGPVFNEQHHGFVVSKDNDELLKAINMALITLRENGEYNKIYHYYFDKI